MKPILQNHIVLWVVASGPYAEKISGKEIFDCPEDAEQRSEFLNRQAQLNVPAAERVEMYKAYAISGFMSPLNQLKPFEEAIEALRELTPSADVRAVAEFHPPLAGAMDVIGFVKDVTVEQAINEIANYIDPVSSIEIPVVVKRIPLPPGSVICYIDMLATVVHDTGGSHLIVHNHEDADGEQTTWEWFCEGKECTVVSIAKPEA